MSMSTGTGTGTGMGPDRIIESVRNREQENRLPHAWLLSGGTREGRIRFADGFTAVLFPDDPRAAEKLADGNLEDYLRIEPEGTQIKVEQIERLIRFFQNKPFAHRRMLAVIADGDALSPACQNKLLKTLEEPTAQNVILILVSNPENLAQTVRSRCLHIRIPGEPPSIGVQEEEDARALVRIAMTRKVPVFEGFSTAESYAESLAQAERLLDALVWFLRDIITGGQATGLVQDEAHRQMANGMKAHFLPPMMKYVGIVEET
ncbi:MAG: hypothetical protein LBD12_04825, partial [Clostridiales Family XIII bacterium]|nr:hypothetical protein [Clostridiales Family XIII bacterium]